MKTKTLFALDFDGVICDSAVETAMTSWIAAQQRWPDMQDQAISENQIQQFRRIRPCLEFGYEAILIMRLLQQGIAMSEACVGYHQQLADLIKGHGLKVAELQELFGHTRDSQIQLDRAEWIVRNPLFKGIAEKLKLLEQDDWVVVTTKQERFVKEILQGNSIELDQSHIFGLDRKMSKQNVLQMLIDEYPDQQITFIEDRLPTLLGVQENPQLQGIKLQLVDWGYNTEVERNLALDSGIEVITKASFLNC